METMTQTNFKKLFKLWEKGKNQFVVVEQFEDTAPDMRGIHSTFEHVKINADFVKTPSSLTDN